MKTKNLKTKQLVALALALLMVMPILLANVHATYPASGTAPYLDVVPTGGATSQSTYTMPMQAVGTTFSVDVRVDNYADVNMGGTNNGVCAASYIVTWNPAVLTFDSYTDGSWLPDQANLGDIAPSSSSVGQLQIGQIVNGGNGQLTADSSSGSVSCTITFTVAAPSSYTIGLEPQSAGVAYLKAPQAAPSTFSTAVTGTIPVYGAQYTAVTTISLYKSGTESTTPASSFEYPAGSDPIGQSFSVDVYISNPNQIPIWSWNVGVTWNPAALQLTTITEGTYLAGTNPTGNEPTSVTLFVPGYINNNAGDIPQGISDVYLSYTTQTATTGVLATLTFEVINYASSTISLQQGITNATGNPLTLETLNENTATTPPTYTPVAVSPAPVLQSFQYTTVSAPAPVAPHAVITNDNPVPTQPWYFPNQAIELDALQSTGGVDYIPNAQSPNFPITSYTWSISPALPAGTVVTGAATNTFQIQAPSLTSPTTYTITLTVATAANPGDPSYVDSSTATTTIIIGPPGAVVDVYVSSQTGSPSNIFPSVGTYNGAGIGNPCDTFGPQQLMNLVAYVSFNGGSVEDVPVTLTVMDGTTYVAELTNYTNSAGYVFWSYRLPAGNNQYPFGEWTVTASTEVAQVIKTDTMPFQFGYLVTLSNVQVSPPTGSSSIIRGSTATLTFDLASISANPQTCWVTYTVLDANNVPVVTDMSAATEVITGTLNTVGPATPQAALTINIPVWAYVGDATIQVNIFNANPIGPNTNAVPYCPGQTASFMILS